MPYTDFTLDSVETDLGVGRRFGEVVGDPPDVEPTRLVGERDFLLSLAPPLPRLRPPLVAILGAKRNDIEAGLGQCTAQWVAARVFNERAGLPARPVNGCETTGEAWQLLRPDGDELVSDPARRYIDRLGSILAALPAAVGPVGAG